MKKPTVSYVARRIEVEVQEYPIEEYTSDLPARLAQKFSRGDKLLALAGYLKWDMPSMSGVSDEDWLGIAKQCAAILGVK